MTAETKQLFAEIHSEIDRVLPGWRAKFTNFAAVMKALAGEERAAKVRELVGQYRTVQKQLSRAVPSLSKFDEGGVRAGDKDVSVLDNSPIGRGISAERRDEIGYVIPPVNTGYDTQEDEAEFSFPHGGKQLRNPGREEDSLCAPAEVRIKKGVKEPASLRQRVREAIGYDWNTKLSFFPTRPPRLAGCY